MVEVEKVAISSGDIEETVRRFNLLCDEIANGAYKKGARNNITVDLSILCYELGLDPMAVMDSLVDWPDVHAKRDFERRVKVIDPYLTSWDRWGIESYMLGEYDCGETPKKEWVLLV